jgi:hypothetical protein
MIHVLFTLQLRHVLDHSFLHLPVIFPLLIGSLRFVAVLYMVTGARTSANVRLNLSRPEPNVFIPMPRKPTAGSLIPPLQSIIRRIIDR